MAMTYLVYTTSQKPFIRVSVLSTSCGFDSYFWRLVVWLMAMTTLQDSCW